MTQNFTHLHLHTDASIRDGLGTVRRMMTRAKRMGFENIAMTDHGTLANAITFSIEAKAAGIKPLIGLEGYISFDGKIGHITLLADGMRGWNSLLLLNNKAHRSELRQPAFLIDDLVSHSDGLVCLTGCIASPFHQLSYDESYSLGLKLKKAFGYKLFAEVMFVNDGKSWERSLRLSSRLGIKAVITNDVHFPEKTDGIVHPILTKMKSGFSYDSADLYLKSFQELKDSAIAEGMPDKQVNELLYRTSSIANRLGLVELKNEPRLPKVSVTEPGWVLLNLIKHRTRFRDMDKSYSKRLTYEMGVINKMGYDDYFIILDDIIQFAKSKDVKIGPGRGSGSEESDTFSATPVSKIGLLAPENAIVRVPVGVLRSTCVELLGAAPGCAELHKASSSIGLRSVSGTPCNSALFFAAVCCCAFCCALCCGLCCAFSVPSLARLKCSSVVCR